MQLRREEEYKYTSSSVEGKNDLECVVHVETQDDEGNQGTVKRKLEDLTISELSELKTMVDELYGAGKETVALISKINGVKEPATTLGDKVSNNARPKHGEEASKRSFRDALTDGSAQGSKQIFNDEEVVPLKPIALPRVEGGNVVVKIDEENYQKGVNELQYSVVRRLSLQKGEMLPTTLELRAKLIVIWKFDKFQLIPMGKGIYHVLLHTMNAHSFSIGALYMKLGVFRTSCWTVVNKKITRTQVWARIYNLSLEYRKHGLRKQSYPRNDERRG